MSIRLHIMWENWRRVSIETLSTTRGSYNSPYTLCVLRLPKTPAVRVPRHKERVYSISVNGSPIAAGNEDIVINVPIGNGEVSVQLAGLGLLDPTGQDFI